MPAPELVVLVPQHRLERRIGTQKPTLDIPDRDADLRVFVHLSEPPLTFLELPLGVLPLRDVARDADDAAVRKSGQRQLLRK